MRKIWYNNVVFVLGLPASIYKRVYLEISTVCLEVYLHVQRKIYSAPKAYTCSMYKMSRQEVTNHPSIYKYILGTLFHPFSPLLSSTLLSPLLLIRSYLSYPVLPLLINNYNYNMIFHKRLCRSFLPKMRGRTTPSFFHNPNHYNYRCTARVSSFVRVLLVIIHYYYYYQLSIIIRKYIF